MGGRQAHLSAHGMELQRRWHEQQQQQQQQPLVESAGSSNWNARDSLNSNSSSLPTFGDTAVGSDGGGDGNQGALTLSSLATGPSPFAAAGAVAAAALPPPAPPEPGRRA